MTGAAQVSSTTGFTPTSGSWFDIDGETYSTQNANDAYSVALNDSTFRFELHAGDHWASDANGNERTEIRSETVYAPGEAIHVSYSFMIEPGAENTATGRGGEGDWLILGQFHANDWESQPAFAIEMLREKMAIVVRYGDPVDSEYLELFVDTKDIDRGHYYDMDIEVRFESDNTGFLNVWRDGEQIVSYSGPLGYDNGVYWKYGIYRSETDTEIAVNYAEISVGKGGNGVAILGTPAADEITPSQSPAGQPTITNQGDTIIAGGGSDIAIAGKGNDRMNGSKGNDVLNGGAGNDIIKGGAGNDELYGLGGNNKLIGGKGNDTIFSENGIDLLKGGKGNDTFSFSADFGKHTISGFRSGEDTIRFDKTLFPDYAALKGAMSNHGGGVAIGDGEGFVFIAKVNIASLDAGDFLFA
jgi:Ca2+-binding RTX toxin-like protein